MRGSIDRSGKNSWRLRFDLGRKADGRRDVRTVTVKGRRRDAEAKLAELVGAKNTGTLTTPNKITVGEFLRERLKHWRATGGIGAKTAERYAQLLANQIEPHLGLHRIQELNTLHVEQWHATLLSSGRADGKGGVSVRTVGHAHRLLAKALGDAVRHRVLSRNVGGRDGQRTPRVGGEEIEILTADEIDLVLGRLHGRAIYPKVIVLLFTGLRRGELLALKWKHVDFEKKMLEVREAVEETAEHGCRIKAVKTKAGRRDISLPDIVIEALSEHRRRQLERRMALGAGRPDRDALVFPARDLELSSPRQLSGDWREACAAYDLPRRNLHALRHTHCSQLIDAGIDVVKISKRLGHSSPDITLRIYAHLFAKVDALSAEAINRALQR